MIEIKINNSTLALPVDFQLNQEVESKIFTKSDEAYDFTYPVDLPLTAETRLALGFPDVLAISVVNKEYVGTLSIDGIFVAWVKIVVLSVSLKNQTCRISMLGQYASLGTAFGTKKVNELTMGGPELIEDFDLGTDDISYNFSEAIIKDGAYDKGPLRVNYSGTPVNSFMRKVAKGIIVRDYLFPKAVDIAEDLAGSPGGYAIINAWDHKRDRYVDADLYNVMATEWQYIPDISPPNAFDNADRHFWVPMYKLIPVLRYCFSESGITLIGNVLTDPKLQNMVLYNTHAINIGFTGGWVSPLTTDKHYQIEAGFPRAYIFPNNHLPNITIIEFINELGRRFNWQFDYNILDKTVTIREDRNLATTAGSVMDLSAHANPNPTINFEHTELFYNGYNIKFDNDANDNAVTENVLDQIDKSYRYRGAYGTEGNLLFISSPLLKDYAYVRNVNSYYEYKDTDGWVLLSHGVMPYRSTNNDSLQEIVTKVVSNPMAVFTVRMIHFMPGYGRVLTLIGDYYDNDSEPVPFSSIGMTFDRYDYFYWDEENGEYYTPGSGHPWDRHRFQAKTTPKQHLPHLVNCIGFQYGIDATELYYMATTGSYNANGGYLNIYSCSPGNPEGYSIYNDWWESLTKLYENSMAVEYVILMNASNYSRLQVNGTMITIDNLSYFIRKANFVMPFPSLCTLSLVRL